MSLKGETVKNKLFDNPVTGDDRIKEKRLLYVVFILGLMIIYSRYLPIIQDLYTARESIAFSMLVSDLYENPVFKFESMLIFLFLAVLYCFIRHIGVSLLVTSVGMFVLTHASYIKFLNRRELFRLDDLKLTEAAGMATSYIHIKPDRYFFLLLLFFSVLVFAGYLLERLYRGCFQLTDKKKKLYVLGIRVLVAVLLGTVIFFYYKSFMRSQKSVQNVEYMSVLDTESNRYLLYRFFENDSIAGISLENIDQSYAFFEEQDSLDYQIISEKEYPNVIVVMNESWWNTDNFPEGRVSFSEDPMSVYRELEKKCFSGFLTSNVYGGGTVSSEAEFLTGLNTKYFVTASGIYEDSKGRVLPSVVDYFNALNYKTTAIHPYYHYFYSRDAVYSGMGFDKMVFEDSMDYTELYSKYISDESLANQIIKEFEEGGDEKAFIWALSIANHRRHLKYTTDGVDFDYPISIKTNMGTLTEQEQKDITNYINGIYYANLAYKQLVEYFEKQDKPVILVMFGDHIPNYQASSMDTLGFGDATMTSEILEKMYSVPVLVWSNCLDEDMTFCGENIGYLSEMILEKAGMPKSDMMQVLRTEREQLRTNSRHLIRDVQGNILEYLNDEQIIAVNHFKNIQYDVLLGECKGRDLWLPKE